MLEDSASLEIACRPEEIWPLLADTARYNEAVGLPGHEILETPRPDGSVLYQGRTRMGPFGLEWEEFPCNWVSDQWFEHRRVFAKGPLEELTAVLTVEPSAAGSLVRYTVRISPRGLLGRAIVRKVQSSGLESFRDAATTAAACALGKREQPFDYRAPALPAGAEERLREAVRRIEASGHGHGLAERLARLVREGQEVDLLRIRPLALARRWRVPARAAVELCLQATRDGLLGLTWSLLCPRCRVAKANAGALDELPAGAHCSTCNIDYERDFAKSVELAFRPEPAIRPLASGEYCLFGPLSMPHVKLQVALDPGESRTVSARLAPGAYRYRTLSPGPEAEVEIGETVPAFTLVENAIEVGSPAAPGEVRLENRTGSRRVFLIEERAWIAEALTADRVATFQAFRDLFSDQVLRPGDEVAVRHVTLMFTDLRASTALYGRIGDAGAYHLVREHFAYLARQVREHDGAIVKTIGDAIMAAFHEPAEAVRAALAIQGALRTFNEAHGGETPIAIKIGLHGGPLIAVTLNDRLDYFGTTANLAARLQAESEGDDIVLSSTLARDPAVAPLLAGLPASKEQARLKGFGAPVDFLRVRPGATAGTGA